MLNCFSYSNKSHKLPFQIIYFMEFNTKMIQNFTDILFFKYTPVGHGVKAAELQVDDPIRVPGQVQQPEGVDLSTQDGEANKLPPRAPHKQDTQARQG